MKKNLLVARAVLEGSNSEASRILEEFDGPKMFPYLNHTTQAEIAKWVGVDPNIVRHTSVIRSMPMARQMIKSCDAMKDIANKRGLRFKTVGQRTVRFFYSELSDEHYIDITFGAGDRAHLYSSSAVLSVVICLCDKSELCEMIYEYVCGDDYYKAMIARMEQIIEVEAEEKRKAKKDAKVLKLAKESIDESNKSRSEVNLEPLRGIPETGESNKKEGMEFTGTVNDLADVLSPNVIEREIAQNVVEGRTEVINLTADGLARIIKVVIEEVTSAMGQKYRAMGQC